MLTLILGGARSGKSGFAEQLARQSGLPVTYVATAEARDDEMRARIATHRARRPSDWQCLESPLELAATLRETARPGHLVLVDCLTLWLSNALHAPDASHWEHERSALLQLLPGLPGAVVLVGNEVGSGVVPLGALTRRFVDESGRLYQAIAARADCVCWILAGLPLTLKGTLP